VHFIGERGNLSATGASWQALALSGHCEGSVPAEHRHRFNETRLVAPADPPATDSSEIFGGLIESFVDSLRAGVVKEPLPTVQHARNIQAIVAAACESGASGEPRRVPWRHT
jgi:hypothetical protein